MSLTMQVGGRDLALLPQRAAFLPDERLLLVADAHFGKAQSFRRLGVPVPGGTTEHNLESLTALVASTGARGIVFLGDLLHSRQARSAATLRSVQAWRERHRGVAMTLVRGNHDSRAGDPPAEWAMEVVDEPWLQGPLALCHHPAAVEGHYTLAGHLHPAAVLGRGVDRLRLPCFHFGEDVGVLPAFGAFTGMHTVQAQAGDRVYVVAHDSVRLLPG
jgi:DNA ligase-associated metallophosphoesterase